MKPTAKSYLIAALAGAVLVLTGCAAGPTGEVAQTNAAKRVIAAYQVGDLLAQASPAVAGSLAKNLPDDVSAADRRRLDGIVKKAYVPEHLRRGVVRRLKRSAANSDHKDQLAASADALEKPLAQRMIRLENRVTEPHFAAGFKRFVNRPASPKRKKRLKIIDQLAENMQVIKLQTNFNITLLETMIRARNAALESDPPSDTQPVDADQLKQILANTRAGISAKLKQQVPLMLLYVYRSVDTPTLQRYADLQSQPALIWTNGALEQAIVNTVAAASHSISKQFKRKDST